jgi:hypothetical protein
MFRLLMWLMWQALASAVFNMETPDNSSGFGICLPTSSTMDDFKAAWAPSVEDSLPNAAIDMY